MLTFSNYASLQFVLILSLFPIHAVALHIWHLVPGLVFCVEEERNELWCEPLFDRRQGQGNEGDECLNRRLGR